MTLRVHSEPKRHFGCRMLLVSGIVTCDYGRIAAKRDATLIDVVRHGFQSSLYLKRETPLERIGGGHAMTFS